MLYNHYFILFIKLKFEINIKDYKQEISRYIYCQFDLV